MSMSERQRQLVRATENGESTKIEHLIASGLDVNDRDHQGVTMLNLAAYDDVLASVESLCALAADVNIPNCHGVTPLMWAAKNGNLAIVNVLLRAKANPALANDTHYTAMGLAAEGGHLQIIEKLLSIGIKPDEGCKDKTHPLICAAQYGHMAVVKRLLAFGPNIEIINDALSTAFSNKHFSIVYHLRSLGGQLADINKKMLDAARDNDYEQVQFFLSLGANINAQDTVGVTMVTLAVHQNKLESVETLCALAADVNIPASRDITPLMRAAQNGNKTIVTKLLRAKADPALACWDGKTAMSYAAENGHHEIVDLFLSMGIKPDRGCKDETHPLICAARNGHMDIVKKLLMVGANLEIINDALTAANSNKHSAIVAELRAAGADCAFMPHELQENASKVKQYLDTHKAALPQRSWIVHKTIGESLKQMADAILSTSDDAEIQSLYRDMIVLFNNRLTSENAKKPRKETANHKLWAIHDISKILSLTEKLFDETDVEDSLPAYHQKILTQAQQIQIYIERNKAQIKDDSSFFGISASIGHILCEQSDTIIASLSSQTVNLVQAYKAYDTVMEAIQSRYEKEKASFKKTGRSSDEAQALNQIFIYMLRQEIWHDDILTPEANSELDVAVQQPTPAPSAPPAIFDPLAAPSITNHAGAGVGPEQLAIENAAAEAETEATVSHSPCDISTSETDADFARLLERANFAKPLAVNPSAPNQTIDIVEWTQREKAKMEQQQQQALAIFAQSGLASTARGSTPEQLTSASTLLSDLAGLDYRPHAPVEHEPSMDLLILSTPSSPTTEEETDPFAELVAQFPAAPASLPVATVVAPITSTSPSSQNTAKRSGQLVPDLA